MKSDPTTPEQVGDKGLAPCKSPEGGQGEALGTGDGQAPGNEGEAGITHAQHNGHEDNIAADSTLPVGSRIHAVIRENLTVTGPVMWAGPGSPGSRSERPPAQAGTAGGVPWEAPAEQGAERGATVAGPDQAKQAQPAWGNGTEAYAADGIGREGFAHEGFANEGFDAEEDAKRASASEGRVSDAAKAGFFDTSSFNTMRSAAKWWMHGKVEDLLRQQDRLQREGGATQE